MRLKSILQPGRVDNLMLKNRMIMPAMYSYAANENGSVSSATINHYAGRAAGGVGLIVVEMTNPSPGCQVFPGNLDLSSDAFKPGFARLSKAIHARGAKCFVQLTHGGVFIQCLRCNECIGSACKDINLRNPSLGLDDTEMGTLTKTDSPNKIAVVGAGPAGMSAAIAVAQRGHSVVLFEQSSRLGGLLYYVGKPVFKEDYRRYTEYLIHSVKSSTVEIRLNTKFTEHTVEQEQLDHIIAATGSQVLVPPIEGADETLNPLNILDGSIPQHARRFIVCDARLVGCEVSVHLAEKGYEVTMIDIIPDSHPAKLYATDWSVNAKLALDGINVHLGNRILKMGKTQVVCQQRITKMAYDPRNILLAPDLSGLYQQEYTVYTADAVICALGLRSVNRILRVTSERLSC